MEDKETVIDNTENQAQTVAIGRRRRKTQKENIPWSAILTPERWIKITVIGILFCLLFRYDIRRMVLIWINDGNWSHGFIIPLFSLYFLHQRKEQLMNVEYSTSWFGLFLMLICILGYTASIYPLKMGYPRLIALLGTLFGIVLFCCGWKVIRITWLPILFLFFALPLPTRTYVWLTLPMRHWASEVAAAFLNILPNIEANAYGVVIEGVHAGKSFSLNVAEACAGMRLMMAFFALGVAMAYLSDRPYWHRIILVLFTLPIALFCNFLRVIITGIIYIYVNPLLARGGFHTTLGLLMLPLAFLMYWGIAAILNMLFIEEEENPVSNE